MKYSEELITKVRRELTALVCRECSDVIYDNDIEDLIDIIKEGLE